MSVYIAHSRTPGSKNGVRKYQNEDGTWTPEGLERRRQEYALDKKKHGLARAAIASVGVGGAIAGTVAGGIAASKNQDRAFKPGKDNKPSPIEKVAKSSSEMIDNTKKINELFDAPQRKRLPVNDLSNKELEDMIKRMDLEKRYSELSLSAKEKGRDWIGTTIAAAGGVAALVGSAAMLITAIKKIKGDD